jgi:hypothetical protein
MALNVAARQTRIKHVFDWRVGVAGGPRGGGLKSGNYKCVTLAEMGYFCFERMVETDELVSGVI